MAWADATPLHTGALRTSPFETNELAAGIYRFYAAVVDSSGNISDALIVEYELGDPRLRAVLFQQLEHLAGWPGTLTDCYIDENGSLSANTAGDWDDLPATWSLLPGRWDLILPGISPIGYRTLIIDLGVNVGFTPRVTITGNGTPTVTMAYGVDGQSPQVGSYGALGNVVGRYVGFDVQMAGTSPRIDTMAIILDGETQVDDFEDINTATESAVWFDRTSSGLGVGRFRVGSKSGQIAAITHAKIVAIQNVGAGWSWELISKAETVNGEPAAEFALYNGSDVLANAVIDVEIKGAKRG